jgi:hypothetical protein
MRRRKFHYNSDASGEDTDMLFSKDKQKNVANDRLVRGSFLLSNLVFVPS